MSELEATRDWFRRAAVDLAATSARQVSWALGVADDDELLARIAALPREHRQPSLLFAVAAWAGVPAAAYPEWRDAVLARWDTIGPAAAARRTQTNEVGRCIPLLLGLSRIDGPIALLELGAAAGLCLAVDRYAYRVDGGPVLGSGSPLLTAVTSGSPDDGIPIRMPDIVWRAGIDLAPLDVRDADDVRWLEALLPPDRPERLARLRAAISTVAGETGRDGSAENSPPRVVAGDALGALAEVARDAPQGAALVVASLGTLVYLPAAARAELPGAVAALGGRLLAFEPVAAVPGVAERLTHLTAPEPTPFVLSLDGWPIAHASAHGDRVSWLAPRA